MSDDWEKWFQRERKIGARWLIYCFLPVNFIILGGIAYCLWLVFW